MTNLRFTNLLDNLPSTVPFVGPETQERERGDHFKSRIGANENVFGPSPMAIKAMQNASTELWKYGDPTSFDLRKVLSEKYKVGLENIVIGEGIDGLLGYICRMLIEKGDDVVTSDGAYPTFNYHVSGYGGILHKVPYKEDYEDLEALLRMAKSTNAKILYVANPDNPMGTWHNGRVLTKLTKALPKNCLLVLDEAYIEFAPSEAAPPIDIYQENVVRLRTFSKGYGMAGARIGYALGAEVLIRQFEKIRNHFGISLVAQRGAIAALADDNWLSEIRTKVSQARNFIKSIAEENNLMAIPSGANFVAIDCGNDGKFAKSVLEILIRNGLFLRMPFVAPQNRCIRISVGTKDDLRLLKHFLPEALLQARKGG